MLDNLRHELRHQILSRQREMDPDFAFDHERAIWDEIADDLADERAQRERAQFEETFITTPLADQLNPAGWPRPVLTATVTRTKASGTKTDQWPTPWITQLVQQDAQTKTVLKEFNKTRQEQASTKNLCQVCGEACEQTAYAPVQAMDLIGRGEVFVSGSPVCSVRCAKLAIAYCPHFDINPALISFNLTDVSWTPLTFEFHVSTYEVIPLS